MVRENDTLLEQGDLEEAAWKRVHAAIAVLLLNENGGHFASMVDAHATKLFL